MSNLRCNILTLTSLSFFLLFFSPILSSYFSQDDFYHLRVIMNKNFSDIPSFFTTWQEGQTFYRPLSREVFNLIMYKTFKLDPLPFHLVNLSLIITNALLIFFLIRKMNGKALAACLAFFIYAVNAIHSVELYYLASVQTLIATTLMMLSIIFYPFRVDKFSKKYLVSLLMFIGALFSHETAIILPVILLFIRFIMVKNTSFNKETIFLLGPFFIIGTFHLITTSLFKNLPSQLAYQPVFSIKSIFNTLGWYIAWSMGLPEMLVDFVGPKLSINPNLALWYGTYFKIVAPLFGILFLGLSFLIIKLYKILLKDKFFLSIVISYLISLSPFLLFPQHKFIYYLSFPIIWFSLILALVLERAWEGYWLFKISSVIIMICILIISYQTIELNKITHWAAKRSVASRYLIDSIKQNYPVVKKGTIFYFEDDLNYPVIAKEWGTSSKQAFYILSGADGLKLLYQDSTIKAYFAGLGGLPEDVDQSRVIRYVAQFPY